MTNLIKQKFGAATNLWTVFPAIVVGVILIAILYITNVISVWSTLVMLVLWLVLIQGNLEVFLIAFIMAMIIRCFSIEVYKIPTGSMEPTLHGDYVYGDKIIADKFTLLFRKMKRFDVLLFRFPMDKTTNFIKRVVGLPNEELMIKGGDLYFRPKGTDKFIVAKKPLATQESIWIDFGGYKWDGSDENLTEAWELSEVKSYKIQEGKLYLQGNNIIRYKDSIKDKYAGPRPGGRHTVSDIKFSFRVHVEQGGGEISSILKTPSGNFSLRLFPVPDGEPPNMTWHYRGRPPSNTLEHYSASGHPTPRTLTLRTLTGSQGENPERAGSLSENTERVKSLPIDMRIEPGKDYLVEILNFDGSIYIKINKKVVQLNINNEDVQQYDYITFLEPARTDGRSGGNDYTDKGYSYHPISVEVKRNSVQLWDFKIVRDIYYSGDYDSESVFKENKPLVIPNGKYIAMGDNVPNSKDSRLWRLKKITLKNGKVIKCDAEPSSGSYFDDGKTIKILRDKKRNRGGDIWGISHIINKADIASMEDEESPFIDSDEVFGEALFIYWPLSRIKFIH